MKKIFLWGLCFLLVTAIIPFSTGIIRQNSKADLNITAHEEDNIVDATKASPANSQSVLTDKDTEIIVTTAMEYIGENSDKQTKLAILSLCANNYIYNLNEKNQAEATETSRYSDKLLQELTDIYNSGIYELRYSGEIVYIPLVTLCPGYTVTSEAYPYIQAVASPWDALSDEFTLNKDYNCGISLYGIEYLCKNTSDAGSALRWYLPDFEFTLTAK